MHATDKWFFCECWKNEQNPYIFGGVINVESCRSVQVPVSVARPSSDAHGGVDFDGAYLGEKRVWQGRVFDDTTEKRLYFCYLVVTKLWKQNWVSGGSPKLSKKKNFFFTRYSPIVISLEIINAMSLRFSGVLHKWFFYLAAKIRADCIVFSLPAGSSKSVKIHVRPSRTKEVCCTYCCGCIVKEPLKKLANSPMER